LRLLVLDRDPDAPRWMIMSAVLSSDTMPAEISHEGRYSSWSDACSWVTAQLGHAVVLTPLRDVAAWTVTEPGSTRKIRAFVYRGVRAGRITPENAEVMISAAEQHAADQTEPAGLPVTGTNWSAGPLASRPGTRVPAGARPLPGLRGRFRRSK
jgi:hypothetical protein